MGKLKIGIMGTIRGSTFIKLLQVMDDRACLWAVCEADSKKAEAVKEKLPAGIQVYADYDEFLDSGMDAVVLCNFFHEHAACAIKAMKKGIAVLSDTTAAPTMGECVELVRTAEQTGTKYMLAANCPYMKSIQFMRKQYRDGKLGDLYFAEAEYLHKNPHGKPYADDSGHWRRKMPGTYYNMHTLGTLMYLTDTIPKRITARAVRDEKSARQMNLLVDHNSAFSLCEMDNGAVFQVTGCAYFGPTSKWYRLIGSNGVFETRRYDETTVYFANGEDHFYPDKPMPEIETYKPQYAELDMVPEEEFNQFTEEQMKIGHSGMDFWMLIHFIKYLNGEYEPFFNVYRAAALSAAGILGWRSVRNQCREYEIPDFTKEEERAVYENDFLSPFVEEDDPNFYPRKMD